MALRVLGLTVERKTDVLAFAAFLISLATVLFQVGVYLRGDDPSVVAPSYISLYEVPCFRDKVPRVELISPAVVINQAPQGYSSVVVNSFITAVISTSNQRYAFSTEVTGEVTTVENELTTNDKIDCMGSTGDVLLRGLGESVLRLAPLSAIVIEGGSAFGKTLHFASAYYPCHQTASCKDLAVPSDFREVEALAMLNASYAFEQLFVLHDGRKISATCRGRFSDAELDAIVFNRRADLACIQETPVYKSSKKRRRK